MQCLLLKVYIEKAKFQPEKKYKQKELKAAKHLQYLPKNAKSLTHTQNCQKCMDGEEHLLALPSRFSVCRFFTVALTLVGSWSRRHP